jgi:hypothetical protein
MPTNLPEREAAKIAGAITPDWLLRALIWPLHWRFKVAAIVSAVTQFSLPLAHRPSCRHVVGWLAKASIATGLWAVRNTGVFPLSQFVIEGRHPTCTMW